MIAARNDRVTELPADRWRHPAAAPASQSNAGAFVVTSAGVVSSML
jgi:hypothetical protein